MLIALKGVNFVRQKRKMFANRTYGCPEAFEKIID